MRHWNQQACVAVWRDWVSQLQQQYQPYGIWPLPQNFCVYAEFRENTEIPRQRSNFAAPLEIPRFVENCGPYREVGKSAN